MASKYLIGYDLPALVKQTYEKALAVGKVIYTASDEVAVISTSTNLRFQLRFCPSLAKKPTAHDDASRKHKEGAKRDNPFANPDSDMVIAHMPADTSSPTHTLILNKFPIIAEHFMLITKEAKEQTHKLEAEDVEAVYAVLKAWKGGLFAFFNSGPHSGASQAHRHVQFLPVESMKEGLEGEEWTLLVDDLRDDMPGVWCRQTSGLGLQDKASSYSSYESLFGKAEDAVRAYVESRPGSLDLHDVTTGSAAFSYNLGMSLDKMAIFPRRNDGMKLVQDGKQVGFACLNGALLGGSLMVKRQAEFDYLKSKPQVMDDILATIGVPGNDGAKSTL